MNKTIIFLLLSIVVLATGCPRRTRVVYVEKDYHEPRYNQHSHNHSNDYSYNDSYDNSYDDNSCVSQAPPQVIVEHHRPRRPGNNYVWVDGHWRWNGYKYVWNSGHWRKVPRGYKNWRSGSWVKRPRGWIWIEGRWN